MRRIGASDRRIALQPQRRDSLLIGEVLDGDLAIDLRQIADDDIAEPDQEPCKDQCDDPQAAVEQAFGEAQGFAHEAPV